MCCFILVAILSVPLRFETIVSEYVDCIELNHFFDDRGRLVYDQVIFYEQTPTTGKFQVRAWCLVEDRELLNRRPIKNEVTALYEVEYVDTNDRLAHRIRSRLFRESWSQSDPERDDKKKHPESLRIGLAKRPIVLRIEEED